MSIAPVAIHRGGTEAHDERPQGRSLLKKSQGFLKRREKGRDRMMTSLFI